MLNFREELKKIKLNKLKNHGVKPEASEKVLKQVLNYLANKTIPQFMTETELFFSVSDNILSVKENKNSRHEVVMVCQVNCEDQEEAKDLLISIEDLLQKEGYNIIPGPGAADLNGCFYIKIDPSK